MTEVVYVVAHARGNPVTLHVDPDCPRLAKARKVLEKPADVYPPSYAPFCEICAAAD